MKTKVLITGGDKKAVALIDILRGVRGVEVIGICDTDDDSSAMRYARRVGLKTSTALAQSLAGLKADIVIDTSGSGEFRKALRRIASREIRVVDAKAAELLIGVAKEKEKAKRAGELYLVNKLSTVFSAKYDIHTVAVPIFDLLRSAFRVNVEAILIYCEPKDELVIAAAHPVTGRETDEILEYLGRSPLVRKERELKKTRLNIVARQAAGRPGRAAPLKSFIAIPLRVKSKEEGVMVLASAKKKAFDGDDIIILNILADELALFIENERIGRDLAAARNRLESMLHSMNEGVIALNDEMKVVLVNPAARDLLGVQGIVVGGSLKEALGGHESLALFRDLTADKDFVMKEVAFPSGAGAKTMRFYVAQVYDNLGKPSGWIVLMTDITKEKEVDRMKSEFIATTSHELRTPLTAIKESVMLLLDGSTGDISEQQRHFLGITRRNIDRLAALINDLLDLSKIETGRMKMRKAECDIAEVVHRALSPMEILAREKNLLLAVSIEDRLPPVICDPDRVTQVIVNLVGNAIKFTPAGGSVTVNGRAALAACREGEKKERCVELSVKDTGIGISDKDIAKLFARFGQLDSSLTRKSGGTGLGLAICRELVELHGGRIWVESTVGKGTAFKFTLPVRGHNSAAAPRHDGAGGS